jgi:sec-independent protein translocase protein TatA
VGSGILSPWHLAILAIVLLLIFGPKRLPEMGRSLGHGLREFKDSVSGLAEATHDERPDDAQALAATHQAGQPAAREHDSV